MSYYSPKLCLTCRTEVPRDGTSNHFCSKKCREKREWKIKKLYQNSFHGRLCNWRDMKRVWLKKQSESKLLFELAKTLEKIDLIDELLGHKGFEMLEKMKNEMNVKDKGPT